MASGLNKVMLIGNLGDVPEIHESNGKTIAVASVATSESWLDKETNERQTRTEWHRVVFYNQMALNVKTCVDNGWMTKGLRVYVEGKNRTREYEKDGIKRKITEVVADGFDGTCFKMIGNQPGGQQNNNQGQATGQQQPGSTQQQQTPANFDQFDDDIPF